MAYAFKGVGAVVAPVTAKPVIAAGPVKPPFEIPWWGYPAGALAIGIVFTFAVHLYDARKKRS